MPSIDLRKQHWSICKGCRRGHKVITRSLVSNPIMEGISNEHGGGSNLSGKTTAVSPNTGRDPKITSDVISSTAGKFMYCTPYISTLGGKPLNRDIERKHRCPLCEG